jgi:hypothetical protein
MPEFIDGDAVARRLGVSDSHIRKLRLYRPAESPPFLYVGHKAVYPVEQLDAWIASRIDGGATA